MKTASHATPTSGRHWRETRPPRKEQRRKVVLKWGRDDDSDENLVSDSYAVSAIAKVIRVSQFFPLGTSGRISPSHGRTSDC